MKTFFTTIGLLLISVIHAQDFIGKEWRIDNFLGEFPDVTDVYFLKTLLATVFSSIQMVLSPPG